MLSTRAAYRQQDPELCHGLRLDSYDFRGDNSVRVFNTNNGKVVADSTASMPAGAFDSYLTDYLIGALPLKAGYVAQLNANSTTIGKICCIGWIRSHMRC